MEVKVRVNRLCHNSVFVHVPETNSMGLTDSIRPNDSEQAHKIMPNDNDADNVRTLMEFSLEICPQ